MSDILHAWNVTCQAGNLKSCLPTGFHAWKAKSHDWTDVRYTYWPTGMPDTMLGI